MSGKDEMENGDCVRSGSFVMVAAVRCGCAQQLLHRTEQVRV